MPGINTLSRDNSAPQFVRPRNNALAPGRTELRGSRTMLQNRFQLHDIARRHFRHDLETHSIDKSPHYGRKRHLGLYVSFSQFNPNVRLDTSFYRWFVLNCIDVVWRGNCCFVNTVFVLGWSYILIARNDVTQLPPNKK